MSNFTNIKRNAKAGFTLLEVLLVVAIIAILAGIVIIAINPTKQLADSRNAQRSADVTTILNAIYQYELDNNGAFPPVGAGATVSTTAAEICKTGGTCATPMVDLGALITSGKYLVSLPLDPKCTTTCGGNANGNGYRVKVDANNRVTVDTLAVNIENGKTITVTR